jgi:hypothetical protein
MHVVGLHVLLYMYANMSTSRCVYSHYLQFGFVYTAQRHHILCVYQDATPIHTSTIACTAVLSCYCLQYCCNAQLHLYVDVAASVCCCCAMADLTAILLCAANSSQILSIVCVHLCTQVMPMTARLCVHMCFHCLS